jgi:hypothetical protein
MYRLLLLLMVSSAISQLGLSTRDLSECRSRECLNKIERATYRVLDISWKPISVFPEEAKRFR